MYIKYSIDGSSREERHPDGGGSGYSDIKKGESWDVDLSISYKTRLRIDLYDNDSTSSNDYLGGYEYSVDDAGKTLVVDTNSSRDGKYKFHTEPGE